MSKTNAWQSFVLGDTISTCVADLHAKRKHLICEVEDTFTLVSGKMGTELEIHLVSYGISCFVGQTLINPAGSVKKRSNKKLGL